MMTLSRIRPWNSSARMCFALLLALSLAAVSVRPVGADEAKPAKDTKPATHPVALDKPVPESVEDLKAIQQHLKTVLDKVVPATVCLQIGGASGSGVIVREDGYILTAGHVVGPEAHKPVVIIMPDGKRLKGETLGANNGIDSGLVKITTEGKYPFVEMGNSKDVKNADWCVCVGHPGGYKEGRSPVVRVGRILGHNGNNIQSDCTMVGGDSGGPLFDADGKVIGINSRIGLTINSNVHVPVDTFRVTWDRLADGQIWSSGGGGFGATVDTPWLGFTLSKDSKNCELTDVQKNSPAAKAGIKNGDLLQSFDGVKIEKTADLSTVMRKKKPGDEVDVEVLRGKEVLKLKLVIGYGGA